MQSLFKERTCGVDCWTKHPDKIPKKVKAARKRKKEMKTSTAALVQLLQQYKAKGGTLFWEQ